MLGGSPRRAAALPLPAFRSPRPLTTSVTSATRRGPTRPARRLRAVRGRVAEGVSVVLLSAFGLASGVSVLADGFYDVTVWGPITIGVAAVVLALAATNFARPRLVPALAVGSLTSLWLWSWLSSTWAESRDQALLSAGRWALYAAMLAALVLLMRTRRDRWLPLTFAAIGIVAVGLSLVLHMRTGGGETFFFGGRLRDPLGYVNGQGGYFLLGFCPCIALAEQTRSKLLAGVGAAAAVVLGSLLILSETRGVIPAVVVSTVVILLLVPGRARRVWALVVIGIALAAIGQPLLDIYRELPKGSQADPDMVRRAGQQILLAAGAAGVVWAVAQTVLAQLAGDGRDRAVHLVEGSLAAAAVVVAVGGAAIAVGDPVHKIRQQYDDFVNLRVDQDAGSTRFLSGGGYRYDYWRIAWLEFKGEPLHGE